VAHGCILSVPRFCTLLRRREYCLARSSIVLMRGHARTTAPRRVYADSISGP
jgi:hypothetical protein